MTIRLVLTGPVVEKPKEGEFLTDRDSDENETLVSERDQRWNGISCRAPIEIFRCDRCREISFEDDIIQYLDKELLETIKQFISDNQEEAQLKKPPFAKDLMWLITGDD